MVERGVTVMVTTHFLDEAEYCDRIALVYRGTMHRRRLARRAERLGPPRRPAEPTLEDAFIALVDAQGQIETA